MSRGQGHNRIQMVGPGVKRWEWWPALVPVFHSLSWVIQGELCSASIQWLEGTGKRISRNTPGYLFSHLVDYAGTSTVIQAVQNIAICQKWTQAQPWPSSQWTWGSWEQLVLEIIVNLSRSGKIKDKHMHWCQNAYQRQKNGLVGAALNNKRFGGRNIGRNYLGGKFICPDTSPSNLFSMKPQLKKFLSHFQDSIQEGRLLFRCTGFL